MTNTPNSQNINPLYSIGEFLQQIVDFEAYVVEKDFINIFGYDNGIMLWNAYKSRCGSNTTIFYRILDNQERQKFENYLLSETTAKTSKNLA